MKLQKQKEVDALLEKHKEDPKFQEFLRIHQRNSSEAWNNVAILEVGKQYQDEKGHFLSEHSAFSKRPNSLMQPKIL